MKTDPVALELLDRYTAPAGDAQPVWDDVLERAGIALERPAIVQGESRASRRRRRLRALALASSVVAVVAGLAAVTPAGSALVRTFDDFSAWLSGLPGTQAPRPDEAALNQATRRWLDFPRGTRLHRLLTTDADGVRLTLDGYRVEGSLCLQLVATGAAQGSDESCAPLSQLRSESVPALVVLSDAPFGTVGGKHVQIGPFVYTHSARVDVTIGIVADGVGRVAVAGTSGGPRQALVGSDAFLAVVDRPPVGYRTTRAFATIDNRQLPVPLAEAPFGQLNTSTGPARRPLGPSTVQRRVTGGTIAWLIHRQPRGAPVPTTGAGSRLGLGRFVGHVLFQRLIAPDPNSPLREIVQLIRVNNVILGGRQRISVCSDIVAEGSAGGGCNAFSHLFRRGPVSVGETLLNGGDQFEDLSGLVSDQVSRLVLYLSTGEQLVVPIRDNAFVAQVDRTGFPVRLVAYDTHGVRIDVQTLTDDAGGGAGGPLVAPTAAWQTLLQAHSPTGETAKILIAHERGGGVCASFQ
ncbi:MAG: hypothetical protein ACRD6W_00145, partial [Nitrososphaerales archaeon]